MIRMVGLLLFWQLVGCAGIPQPAERQAYADRLAGAKGWEAEDLAVEGFVLRSYHPAQRPKVDTLTVYLEGDGLAWITPSMPSRNPTPVEPLALRLALAQPYGDAVYLARPCQYVEHFSQDCAQRYWTSARFAPEVMRAMAQAVEQLKQQAAATRLILVGYSGGAAIAAWLAAQRTDVAALVSVAGNLDHPAWTRHHRIHALSDSVSPETYRQPLHDLPQWHFVGGRDRVIPPSLVQGFAHNISPLAAQGVVVLPEFDHHCCWVEHWPDLYGMVLNQYLLERPQ